MKRTPSVLGYSAVNEEINTVMNGKDGNDYIVDTVNGKHKWVLYEALSNDEEIIEYVHEPEIKSVEKKKVVASNVPTKSETKEKTEKKKLGRPRKEDTCEQVTNTKTPTIYNIKLGEFMKAINASEHKLSKAEIMKKAQTMYKEWKLTQQ